MTSAIIVVKQDIKQPIVIERKMMDTGRIHIIAWLDQTLTISPNAKYFKDIFINNIPSKAYVDLGSSCNLITTEELARLKLTYNDNQQCTLYGFGNGQVRTLGLADLRVKIDEELNTEAYVVPVTFLSVPVLIGQTLTESLHVVIIKDDNNLRILPKGESSLFPEL